MLPSEAGISAYQPRRGLLVTPERKGRGSSHCILYAQTYQAVSFAMRGPRHIDQWLEADILKHYSAVCPILAQGAELSVRLRNSKQGGLIVEMTICI